MTGRNRHGRLEYYLLIHRHAPGLWLAWTALTLTTSGYTLARGPILTTIPGSTTPLVPGIMLASTVLWMMAGAMAGWLPRPMN